MTDALHISPASSYYFKFKDPEGGSVPRSLACTQMKALGVPDGTTVADLAAVSQLSMDEKFPTWRAVLAPVSDKTSQYTTIYSSPFFTLGFENKPLRKSGNGQ